MKRVVPVLLFAVLVSLSLACQAAERIVFGETPTPLPSVTPIPPTPTDTPVLATPTPSSTPDSCPNGNCITSCVNKLEAIVHHKTLRQELNSDEEHTLVTYQIDGNQIGHPSKDSVPKSLKVYQDDKRSQAAIWDYFAALIPLDQRSFMAHYVVFTDGKDNILASVAQSSSSPNEWDLSVDIIDTSNPKDLTFTLIHEFGHLLTLNPDQVTPSQAIFDQPESDSVYDKETQACSNYFPGEGCSHDNSYINLFVNRFWDEIYDEWSEIDVIEDEDTYYDSLDSFYEKYDDQFVTDYAPTSPAEDVAESWSYFILKAKPANRTIANQKVLFFYEFPELIELRKQIAQNLCDQLEK